MTEHAPFTEVDCPCRVFTDSEEQNAWHAGYEYVADSGTDPLNVDAETLGNALYEAQNPQWTSGSTQNRYYRNEMVELTRIALARLASQSSGATDIERNDDGD